VVLEWRSNVAGLQANRLHIWDSGPVDKGIWVLLCAVAIGPYPQQGQHRQSAPDVDVLVTDQDVAALSCRLESRRDPADALRRVSVLSVLRATGGLELPVTSAAPTCFWVVARSSSRDTRCLTHMMAPRPGGASGGSLDGRRLHTFYDNQL